MALHRAADQSQVSALRRARQQGAREIGFSDLGALWRSGYDMTPAQFEADTERLWTQVKPLYDELHCYVRGRLRKLYGKDKIGDKAPIPAHLLGNMWAQEWGNVYDLVEPYKGAGSLDVTRKIVEKKLDEKAMVRLASGSSPRSASTRCQTRSGSARSSRSPRTARSSATRARGT